MANPLSRLFTSTAETLRVVGTAMAGIMPALRAPDGTFGTQRIRSKELAQDRRTRYPQD